VKFKLVDLLAPEMERYCTAPPAQALSKSLQVWKSVSQRARKLRSAQDPLLLSKRFLAVRPLLKQDCPATSAESMTPSGRYGRLDVVFPLTPTPVHHKPFWPP